MHLHVPDPRAVEVEQLPPCAGTGQRLVDAHRRPERLRQSDVTQQLVGRERLLDVEQPEVVERAEVRLVLGPLVPAIGIDGERHAGALERLADGAHRLRVPAGGHLDLHAAVAVGQRVLDPPPERSQGAVRRNAECHAAGNRGRGREAHAFTEQRSDAGAPAVGLEVPGRGLERRPGEGIAPNAVLQESVDLLGTAHSTIGEAGNQDLLEQVMRGPERLFGIERQLERGRFSVADVAGLVVEHDDERAADGHRAAGDDERLA